MVTVHRNGPNIFPTTDNEHHTYLEYSIASLFHYSILEMRKMRFPKVKCFRGEVSGSVITSLQDRVIFL